MNDTQQKMMKEYKILVKAFEKMSNGLWELNAAFESTNYNGEVDEWYDNTRESMENEFFIAIRAVFKVAADDNSFFQDDWFWAEWTDSDACFWFLYGCSSEARSDERSLRWNEEQNKKEQEVINRAKQYQKRNKGKI